MARKRLCQSTVQLSLTSAPIPDGISRVRRLICLISLFLAALSSAWSQQASRADAASRTAQSLNRIQAATGTTSMDVTTEADFDLGERQPISATSGGFGAYVTGDAGLYYTSNPTLSSSGSRGDMYFAARAGGGIHPNLAGGLYFDAHVSQEVFTYAQNAGLNFTRFNVGAGFDYVFENLGQLTASIRFDYDRYLDTVSYDEIYVNNAIKGGLYKEFLVGDTQAFQLGWQGAVSVSAQPESARRGQSDFWVGWRWRLIEPLELQTFYIVTLYYYPNEPRTDVTNLVGASLTYSLTRWAKLTASSSFSANSSTNSYFDYTAVNLGGALALDIRF